MAKNAIGVGMRNISQEQILERAKRENPWWEAPNQIPESFSKLTPRPYLDVLSPLVENTSIRRAVVLMGPRRVGKTVMIHHMIGQLLEDAVAPKSICYFSVDHPIYNGLSLDDLLSFYKQAVDVNIEKEKCHVFFDEIQYLRDWEIHLKSLVDSYPNVHCLVSGSAAAALRLKSTESGAGRFTDFLLPPLTFHEYLFLIDRHELVTIEEKNTELHFSTSDISALNNHFINYLNFGGYPEAVFSEEIQSDPGRYIKSDIIDKVLLRDLPTLYGIQDIQELNYLFTNLAFNTAGEVSLGALSKGSGVAKNTIKKYIEYLGAAFLIRTVQRVDRNARRFKRANFFKVYLTNPSIRAALFAPVTAGDDAMGSLVETAIFSHWFHAETTLYYARWRRGEVDIVSLNEDQKASWAVEAKWSDRYYDHPEELKALADFCLTQGLPSAWVTTQTAFGNRDFHGVSFEYKPASLYCYVIGYNIVRSKGRSVMEQARSTTQTTETSIRRPKGRS
jgi:predicted AAA+ superfamily ATPase